MLSLRVLGIMSGTSMDGIDFALCHFVQTDAEAPLDMQVIAHKEMTLPEQTKSSILKMIKENKTSMEEVCQLNFTLGKVFAEAANNFLKNEANLTWNDVDLIASHGQTVWHVPQNTPNQVPSTLQLAVCSISTFYSFFNVIRSPLS